MTPQEFHVFTESILRNGLRYHDRGEPAEPAAVTAAHALALKVDELGNLRAVIADLQVTADRIRTELENAGLNHIQGQQFSATVTQVKGSARTDWRTIAQRLKPSAQLIRAHTTTGAASVRLLITARPNH
jgi:hypothetical protein